MNVEIQMRCGHPVIVMKKDKIVTPICPECGERVVKSVSGATPRFTGSCSGPLVQRVNP